MTHKKQTAVDWLDRWFRDNPEATHQEGNKALAQAKELEKQQIIEACKEFDQFNISEDWENYYNKTYGGNNEQQ